MLRNLLSNAFKFTPANGSVKLRISRVPLQQQQQLELGPAGLQQVHAGGGRGQRNGPRARPGSSSQVLPQDELTEFRFRLEVVDSGAGISKENQVMGNRQPGSQGAYG